MKTKHTKGPWEVSKSALPTIEIDTKQGRILGLYGTVATQEANAKLIAASPDLLEASEQAKEKLHQILQEWSNGNFPLPKSVADRIGAISEILETAINKATT